jgi:hypothetical protein
MTTSLVEIILNESVDIYTLPEMENRGMKYSILREDRVYLSATFKVGEKVYQVDIAKNGGFVKNSYDVSFGDVQPNGVKNTSSLLNLGIPLPVCSRVFSFVRYYVDKYNVDTFNFTVIGSMRSSIYDKYLEKHFSDFSKEIRKGKTGDDNIIVCKKI